MKTPEIIKAVQALQSWRVELDTSIHQMKESLGVLQAQSDKHGEAINRLLGVGGSPSPLLPLAGIDSLPENDPLVSTAALKFGDGFVNGQGQAIMRECAVAGTEKIDGRAMAEVTDRATAAHFESKVPDIRAAAAVARFESKVPEVRALAPVGMMMVLPQLQVDDMATDLSIGVADVREVEVAVLRHLAVTMEPHVRRLRALSLHPDVDSITSAAITMFMTQWTTALGLGEQA